MAVDILMSTYNGEKYLENQLLSLLMQRYKDWTLYIRDDGSTDNTLSIIEKFTQMDERIKLVEAGENLKHGKSFFSLLKYATAEYIAFCDQDDIWFEDKLTHLLALAEVEKFNNDQSPSLICSQGYNYSNKTGLITKGVIPKYYANTLQEFLFLNGGYEGCLFLFNRALLEMAKSYTAPFYGHDNVVCLIAHTFGKVKYLTLPLMLYRIHEKNTSGVKKIGFVTRVKTFFRTNATVVTKVAYDQQKEFFDFFYSKLTEQQKGIFEAYLAFPSLCKWGRIKLLVKNKFKLGQYRGVLILKTILRRAI